MVPVAWCCVPCAVCFFVICWSVGEVCLSTSICHELILCTLWSSKPGLDYRAVANYIIHYDTSSTWISHAGSSVDYTMYYFNHIHFPLTDCHVGQWCIQCIRGMLEPSIQTPLHFLVSGTSSLFFRKLCFATSMVNCYIQWTRSWTLSWIALVYATKVLMHGSSPGKLSSGWTDGKNLAESMQPQRQSPKPYCA